MNDFNFQNKLYVITESAISQGRTNEEVVRSAIAGGAKIIQLREKNWSKDNVRREAVKLLKICRDNGILFIVNDYIDIALEIGADGVHLGQSDMPIKKAREISDKKNKNLIIGLSTHSIEQALKADTEEVDYITIGPIFKTRAKDYTVGTQIIKEVVEKVDKPLVSIGGINKDNIDSVLEQGVNCVAVISAVVGANNIKGAVKDLIQNINNHNI